MCDPKDFVIENGVLKKYKGPGGDVVVPKGVKEIGWGAFENCKSITTVTIPEGVTEINTCAFRRCERLTGVNIPISTVEIGIEAFLGTALYKDPRNWKKGVLYIDDCLISAKSDCKGDYSIREGTRLIADRAFSHNGGLTGVTIPEGVEIIGDHVFSCCEKLKTVTLPGSLKYIGMEAFASCGITDVTVPGGLKTTKKWLFEHCKGLTEAVFSEGFEVLELETFYGCENLRRVSFPSTMSTINANAFFGCDALTELSVAKENKTLSSRNGFVFRNGGTELYLAPHGFKGKYVIPDGVKTIGALAFRNCTGLTEIVIPESVTCIGESAFSGCGGLTQLTVPEGVTSIGENAFSDCRGLTDITIPGNVKNISKNAFSGCLALKRAVFMEGVEEIGSKAFFHCEKLTELSIPVSMKKIDWEAFSECPSLERIVVAPDSDSFTVRDGVVFSRDGSELLFCLGKMAGLYTIPEGVKHIEPAAFSNCRELTEVVLPRGMEQLSSGTFSGCHSLTCATIFNDYPGKNIGEMFGYYTSWYRQYLRGNCLITVRDAKSGVIHYQVLLVTESEKINRFLRGGYPCVWGENGYCDFKRLDEAFDEYKDMKNKLTTAYYRLQYPVDLDDKTTEEYRTLIKRNGYKLLPNLMREANIEMIREFLRLGALNKGKTDEMIETAAKINNPEITALLLEYKQKQFGGSKPSLRLTEKALRLWEVKKESPELVWRYNGTETEVVFPTEINGIRIVGIADTGASKLMHYSKIEKIVMPEGYKTIGKNAFNGCINLKEVILPRTLEAIGENAFNACIRLKEVLLPPSVSSLGLGCFANCQALETIKLPETLKKIPNQAFFQCENLKKIAFPEDLISIGTEAFRACRALREIDLGEKVSLLGDRCFYLTPLETVIIRGKKCYAGDSPCFDYPRYVYTDGEIQAIGLPSASRMPLSYLGLKNRELVKAAGSKLLEGLTILGLGALKAFPKIDDYRYKNMSFADFVSGLGGSSAKTLSKKVDLVVTYEIDPENVTIQRAQKQGTTIITELEFLKTIQRKEKPDMEALRAKSAGNAPVPESNDPFRPSLMKKLWKYTELEDGTICLDSYLGKETDVIVPPRIGDKPVRIIGEGSFSPEGPRIANRAGKRAIRSVAIPESVSIIGKEAFHGCTSLTSVTIPEGVASIGWWAFFDCKSLKDVKIPSSVTEIDKEAFIWGLKPRYNLTIHAPAGSYAEQYAKENNIPFITE